MYFRTFDHYDDNDNDHNIIYNNEQCLICWDKNNNVYKMQSLLYSSMYYTSCTCNGFFHEKCLLKWIYKTNSCPICRVKFEFNINDEKLPFTFNIYKLFKLFFTLFFIKILFDIILGIQYAVEKNIQNDADN